MSNKALFQDPNTAPTVTGQQLSTIRNIKVILRDGSPVPKELILDLMAEISFTPGFNNEPIMDRARIRGFGPGEDEPASITINGHYTSYSTRVAKGSYLISPRDFMRGAPGFNLISVPTQGAQFHFDLEIFIVDPSNVNKQDERLVFRQCVLDGLEFNAEPGSNKFNHTILSACPEPEVFFSPTLTNP